MYADWGHAQTACQACNVSKCHVAADVCVGFSKACASVVYVCREGAWWEGPAFQLKLTVLLLVVVMGRPLETYIQSLILVALLVSEAMYECIRRPIRFPVVQHLYIATFSILILSLLCSMFKADFQSTASEGGLQALGILIVIGNLMLCLLFVLLLLTSTGTQLMPG